MHRYRLKFFILSFFVISVNAMEDKPSPLDVNNLMTAFKISKNPEIYTVYTLDFYAISSISLNNGRAYKTSFNNPNDSTQIETNSNNFYVIKRFYDMLHQQP